jgi:hypothetical protein
MTKIKKTKRITLSRTTLRRLDARTLTQVAGGTLPGRTSDYDCGGDIIVFDIVD